MRKIKINGIYKHFKGDYYLVIDIAKQIILKQKKNMLYIEDYMMIVVYGLDHLICF